ncbi:MAG: DUF342 domain-containing protein, partial [Desulfovibrio sp.]|nr:DUF342 domain-containing protein [Desulfovibrio sp.]
QLMRRRDTLWSRLHMDEKQAGLCCLSVPGTVYPGVEISIGRAYMLVERAYQNVCFRLCYDDIIVQPLPKKKTA